MSQNDKHLEAQFDPRWNQWPLPNDECIREALLRAYEDRSWGSYEGPHTEQLAEQLAAYHGVRHALLCASGTVAVQIALRALHLPEASEVILAGYDFPGNFRAIQDSGLVPVLADVATGSWCLDPVDVREAITEKTSAILVSHLHGELAPLEAIKTLAHQRGIAVVEDACQVPGARLEGRRAGSLGDVGVLSFGGSKLLTAGRGGAVLTDRSDLYQRAKIYCNRGNDAFPLSQLQGAVLVPQLARLDAWNARRLHNIGILRHRLRRCGTSLQPVRWPEGAQGVFYKHAWLGRSAAIVHHLLRRAEGAGVPLTSGFRGFFKRPPSQARRTGKLPKSQLAADQTVLLHHPILLQDENAIHWLADWMTAAIEAFERQD